MCLPSDRSERLCVYLLILLMLICFEDPVINNMYSMVTTHPTVGIGLIQKHVAIAVITVNKWG